MEGIRISKENTIKMLVIRNVKYLFFVWLIFLFAACVSSEKPNDPEEPSPPSSTENDNTDSRDICDYDLSGKEGEFTLTGKWEFAGFQKKSSDRLDHITCLARHADFALTGEDFDNVFKVILTLSEEMEGCTDSAEFEAISFGSQMKGCFQADTENINLIIPQSGIVAVPRPANNTFPVIAFENAFLEGLTTAREFHIDRNKLYLYDDPEEKRMVFVALEE